MVIVYFYSALTHLVYGDGNGDGRLVEGIAANGYLQLPLSGNGHRDRSAGIAPRTVGPERNGQRSEVAGRQQERRLDLLGRARPPRAAVDRNANLIRAEHRGRRRDAEIATPSGAGGVERDGHAGRLGEGFTGRGGVDQYSGDGEHGRGDRGLGGDGPAQLAQCHGRMPTVRR